MNCVPTDYSGAMSGFGIVHLIVALLLGVILGVGGVWAYRAYRTEEEESVETAPAINDGDIQSLLAAMPQAHILLTRAGDVERASTVAYSLGLVRGTRITRSEIVAVVNEVRESGQVQDMEMSMRRTVEGMDKLILSVRVAPVSGDRTLVLFFDTTEAKRLEATRRDFVANISHELKTPVGAIGLLAETLQECADEPENVVVFSERLQRESTRLAALVQDIIELSRLQDGAALTNLQLVELDSVVTEAMDRCRIEADSREITLVAGPSQDPHAFGDKSLLTTAIRNLIDNAIRYSNPGGRVSIGVSELDGEMRIAVVDQGVGIPFEQRERVFERFYRGDEARTRETGGSGLGLSIVKHVAADHGGRVELWSEPGKGSTFTFIIPAAYVSSATDYKEEDLL